MSSKKAPMHLWIVGGVSLLWNAMGAFDYLMTQMENEGYMAAFTPEQLEYFYAFPVWATSAWAIAVWSSVLGSVLLLMRNRHAVTVFLVSIVGLAVTSLYNFVLTDGLEVMGGVGPMIFTLVIILVSIGLFFYARAMKDQGVLV